MTQVNYSYKQALNNLITVLTIALFLSLTACGKDTNAQVDSKGRVRCVSLTDNACFKPTLTEAN